MANEIKIETLEEMATRKGLKIDNTLPMTQRAWKIEMAGVSPDIVAELTDEVILGDSEDVLWLDDAVFMDKNTIADLFVEYLGLSRDKSMSVKITAVRGKLIIEAVAE